MPTPECHPAINPVTAGLMPPSSACPAPLTPPSSEAVTQLLPDRPADGSAFPVSADCAAENEDGAMNDNTGAGMVQQQEHLLYMGLGASPYAIAHDETAQYEKSAMEVDLEEHSIAKLLHTQAQVQTLSETNSSDERQSREAAALSPNPQISNPTLRAQAVQPTTYPASETYTGIMPHTQQPSLATPMEAKENGHGTDDKKKRSRKDLLGVAKIDRELDWTSPTPHWDFTRKLAKARYPSSLFQCDSKYEGTQQSDRQTYKVHVKILTVDMDQCTCTGYLTIRGLTPEHDTLQTYFTGEIIGGPDQKYSFRTRTPEWGANEKTDLTHWARFQAWRSYTSLAKKNVGFTYPPNGENWWQQENIFMRWKEHFLVPDHKTRSIMGASFEGFYYICLNQVEGKISGIYFHSKSEKYQQLELKHVGEPGIWHRGVTPSKEFR